MGRKRTSRGITTGCSILLADGEGFEPPEALRLQRFSRPSHSTALPPIRNFLCPYSILLFSKTQTEIKKNARMGVFLFPPNSVGNHGGNLCAQGRVIKKLLSLFWCCPVCVIFEMGNVFLYRDCLYTTFV